VRVASGLAERWLELGELLLGTRDDAGRRFEVEASRAYRDRLVVKLRGVDDATSAGRLRGRVARVPAAEVPELPEGVFYQARLIGLEVVEESQGRSLGVIEDLIETGAVDVLVVRGDQGEVLVPLAREYVRSVDRAEGRVWVRLPEDLEQLNRPRKETTA